jgi:uroporphyrinogen-III synthase
MRLNNQHILITADVDELLLQELRENGFVADVIPFIQTEIIKTKNLQQQIEHIAKLNAYVVFTSKNAVTAVSEYLSNKKQNWKIYCIGNTTKALVEKSFSESFIAGVGNNATEIAEKIIADNNINELYFFCGDKRRNELSELLKEKSIVVTEVEVYTTTILRNKVDKNYAVILFFSPSAVEGFFSSNILSDETILFAIGQTTTDEIKKYSTNKTVISNNPGKKDLIEKVMAFFSSANS